VTLNEYATLIYFWHGDAEVKDGQLVKWSRVPELLDLLQVQMPLRNLGMQFGAAGVVLALEHEAKTVRAREWRRTHRELYRHIEAIVTSPPHVEEWADFWIGRWLISHDAQWIDAILDQAANGGNAGHYASSILHVTGSRCKPFAAALTKARDARKAAMLVH
jgi:hypothetical protein